LGPLPEPLDELWRKHDRSFPVLAALGWRLLMEAYDESRMRVPEDQWVRVRYEDLVADPRDQVGQILARVGLDWTPPYAAEFARYRFSPGRAQAFRDDLSPDDISAMESVLGHSLADHGYR
jgi:hypothetical protein